MCESVSVKERRNAHVGLKIIAHVVQCVMFVCVCHFKCKVTFLFITMQCKVTFLLVTIVI